VPGPNLASTHLPPRQPRFYSLVSMADRWAVTVSRTTAWLGAHCDFGMGPTARFIPSGFYRLGSDFTTRMDIGVIRPWNPPTTPQSDFGVEYEKGTGDPVSLLPIPSAPRDRCCGIHPWVLAEVQRRSRRQLGAHGINKLTVAKHRGNLGLLPKLALAFQDEANHRAITNLMLEPSHRYESTLGRGWGI
jgi:hypothetical protein